MMINNSKKLKAVLQERQKRTQEKLDKFSKDFAANPFHAMEWANTTIRQVAEDYVAKYVLRAFELPTVPTLAAIRFDIHREVMRGAMHPPHSTSPISDIMAEAKLAAFAALLAEISEDSKMTRQELAKKLVTILRDWDGDVRSYSGRGMYGKLCVAIVEGGTPYEIRHALGSLGPEDFESREEMFEFKEEIGHESVREDSLGKGRVTYWPNLPWPE